MKVVTGTGETIGGAAAVVYLARQVWWTWPLWAISRIPLMMPELDRGYRWMVARRYCLQGGCTLPLHDLGETGDWVPMIGGLAVVLATGKFLPAWVWMWSLVGTLYFGFKWITWIRARRGGLRMSLGRGVGYWLLWPGMSPKALARPKRHARPTEWATAVANIAFGAALVWWVARRVPADEELLAGWVGWIGLAFILHFGLMHLAALAWGTEPNMQAPIRAESLREFWGTRWNRAFRDLARGLWFEPIRRRWGTDVATLGVFLFSGLLHELVISVPAGTGVGLPTLFFGLQGIGMLIESHWRTGRWRLLTWIIVVGPAFWLFHPAFIERVVVPMMKAWRAL